MVYLLAFEKFFGISPSDISPQVIVTNINPIYTGFVQESNGIISRNRGFYEIVELELAGLGRYHLLKVAPGNNIIDVIKLLSRYVKEIIFVGIAGCLSDDYQLGEVVEPDVFMKYKEKQSVAGAAICQTDGLVYDNNFYLALRNKGARFIDMECFDVFSLCEEAGVKLKYIIQVSDFPLITPFYSAEYVPINILQIIRKIGGDSYG